VEISEEEVDDDAVTVTCSRNAQRKLVVRKAPPAPAP
jgi:hypothetical protein